MISTSRSALFKILPENWDIVVIGGGITGVGVFNEATRRGFKTLLLEAHDYASGTSSKSSKMVHGGLRYLSRGQVRLTSQALTEREKLLRELPGLVKPLSYVFPHFRGKFPPRWAMRFIIWLYDRLAGRNSRRSIPEHETGFWSPHLIKDQLNGAIVFEDAITDDVRLVLRTLKEGQARGGTALNYTKVSEFVLGGKGNVEGVEFVCQETGQKHKALAKVVINATGIWSDRLRALLGFPAALHPMRGSHIVFPAQILPLSASISFFHPEDNRPIYAYPWNNRTLVGTTDLPYSGADYDHIAMTREEFEYFLRGLKVVLPSLELKPEDIIATYSGLRAIVTDANSSTTEAKDQKRDHATFWERNLLSIAGGKLTTFRPMAEEALAMIEKVLPQAKTHGSFFEQRPKPESPWLSEADRMRLMSCYGPDLEKLPLSGANPWRRISGSDLYWEELEFMLEWEQVEHLDDLMLRRTRLGLIMRGGGEALFSELEPIVCQKLGWDKVRWTTELARYQSVWQEQFSLVH